MASNSVPPTPLDFAGQVAIITGGAGGIGRATAKILARRGCALFLVDLSDAALDKALRDVVSAVPGTNVHKCAADITDVKAAEQVVASCIRNLGRLDALIQTAGITGKTNVQTADVDPDNFDTVIRVNLRGIFSMCRAVLPAMKAQGYGRIVNIASIAGKEGNAGMLAYSSSKAAVIGLTKTIGKEYAESGITVNAVAPAVVRTPMVDAMPAAQVKYMTDKIPMKRTCELQEVAEVIVFAASRACSFTTGFTFDVTGGRATY